VNWSDIEHYALAIAAIITAAGAVFALMPRLCRKVKSGYGHVIDHFRVQSVLDELKGSQDLILLELRPNGGSSLRDSVNRIERKVMYLDAARKSKLHVEPLPQIETDRDGRLIHANAAFVNLVQRPLSDLRGTGWINVLTEEERDQAEKMWMHVVKEKRSLETRHTYVTPQGRKIPVDVKAHPIICDDGYLFGYAAQIEPLDEI